jgi:hypothetical protein
MDVDLDTGEAMIQGIVQGAAVLVVIVRVGSHQGDRLIGNGCGAASKQYSDDRYGDQQREDDSSLG